MRQFLLFLIIASFFLFFSCYRKTTFTEFIQSPFVQAKNHTEIDQIFLILGETVDSSPAFLDPVFLEFGTFEDDGLVTIVNRISDIQVRNPNSIVVSIDGPVKTARDLGRLKAANSELIVVSLFPMDEPLAIEAVSDLIIDFNSESDVLAAETSLPGHSLSESEKSAILLAALITAEQLIISKKDPSENIFQLFSAAMDTVRHITRDRLIGSNWTVSFYIDGETTLRAKNHLILTPSNNERVQ